MKRLALVFSATLMLMSSAHWLPAPIMDSKTGAFYNQRTGTFGTPVPGYSPNPASTAKPQPKPSAKPKSSKPKPTESPSDPAAKSLARFDGTWVATSDRSNPTGGKINGTYTIVIKGGRTATKILETTNVSIPESADYEVHRKWICNSTNLFANAVFTLNNNRTVESAIGSSVTIQWSAGELSDWAPRTISREEIQSYGSPNAETSVYELKGDELKRVNDPNGVTYHHEGKQISSSVKKSRGRIYVYGSVKLQGPQEIPADESYTVSKAVINAGGFGDFANKRKVKLTRKSGEDVTVDLKRVIEEGHTEEDVAVQPNDQIYVPQRLINM